MLKANAHFSDAMNTLGGRAFNTLASTHVKTGMSLFSYICSTVHYYNVNTSKFLVRRVPTTAHNCQNHLFLVHVPATLNK